MGRPARVDIDLAALRNNYQQAKKMAKHQVFAVIKANAYGHGATQVALSLASLADGFAVACIEEALILRKAGITRPILLLEGFFHKAELSEIAEHNLSCVVHHPKQITTLLKTKLDKPIEIWLKMNSGMNRIGFAGKDYQKAWQQLKPSSNVKNIIKMTHLPCADDLNSSITNEQLKHFDRYTSHIPGEKSLFNSPGLLGWNNREDHYTRVGLLLYGLSPFYQNPKVAQKIPLEPVMQLSSRIIAINQVPANQTIGYGGTFTTACASQIATVALGYADGYPLQASSGTPVIIDGQKAKIVGRISMDMLTVDITNISASLGSQVIFWGKSLKVSDIAQITSNIPYNLLTGIKRVEFYYHN